MLEQSSKWYPGRRVSYAGALCTVRYFGPLENTKGEWLGVEWDDPERGKHDGVHERRRVFTCRSASLSAGSFLRPSRAADKERTVLEAIKFKYGGDDYDAANVPSQVVISGKVAEEIGFEKIKLEQSRLSKLQIILLDDLTVVGLVPRGRLENAISEAQRELSTTCPSVRELDLGWSLIETWSDVQQIYSAFPNLDVLKTSGLRFRDDWKNLGYSLDKLHVLELNECLIGIRELLYILGESTRFPALQRLSFSKNALHSFKLPTSYSSYPSVRSLALEQNDFKDLGCLQNILALFPAVSNLSLQGNQIGSVLEADIGNSSNATATDSKTFAGVQTLNLSYNKITSFEFIDALTQTFPNLSSLQISKNPLNEDLSSTPSSNGGNNGTDTSYYLVLARIPKLAYLNHTKITARDREEGEIYYISIVTKEVRDLFTSLSHSDKDTIRSTAQKAETRFPVYRTLCQKYGRECVIDTYLHISTDGSGKANTSHIAKAPGQEDETIYPSGSVAARLVTAMFYIRRLWSKDQPTSNPKRDTEGQTDLLSRSLPRSIPVNTLKALLARHFNLPPLLFKLIYESPELDPVEPTENSTRSQWYDRSRSERERRWREWGDWDVDGDDEDEGETEAGDGDGGGGGGGDMKGTNVQKDTDGDGVREGGANGAEHYTQEGYLIKDGRTWKRREVEIPTGTRPWGDWLEDGAKEVRVRIEPFEVAVKKGETGR